MNKSRQSNRWLNVLVIVGLCICLFWLSSFDEEPQSRYDKSPYSRYPIELICEISRVVDGDTIVAKCPKSLKSSERSLRYIRVWGMDAPETRQEHWGDFATKTLKAMIGHNQAIRIKIIEQDQYQRMIGKLYIDNKDLGLEMVKQGAAVVYHRYNKDQDYINAEKKAKMSRLGIWKVSGAQQNPERWRRMNP